jgi:Protein of unknown function (DUF3105)
MSSRQQEKERRRQERLAAERAAEEAAARKRRTGYLVGGVLAGAAVAAIVIAVAASGGSNSKPSSKPSASQAALDAALQTRAAAAGCTAKTFPSEGRQHTTGTVNYRTNPPTSGDHYPVPASDGIYDPGHTPPITHLVHPLEHGRIEYQYRPGTPPAVVAQLTTLMKDPVPNQPGGNQPGGYLQLLFENPTAMPYAVAATAWTHSITCPTFRGAATLDALRAFRAAYINKGPEFIPVPE